MPERNPADHPLHLAEANHNPAANREKMAELCFEKLGVPALFLSKCAVLTAFASGRGTALVLDIGGGVTSATAVHDGYVLRKSVRRHAFGGDRIHEMVCKSVELRTPAPPLLPLYTLKRQEIGPGEFTSSYVDYPGTHPTFHRYHLLQLFKDAKESACRCHMINPNEQYAARGSKHYNHTTPLSLTHTSLPPLSHATPTTTTTTTSSSPTQIPPREHPVGVRAARPLHT